MKDLDFDELDQAVSSVLGANAAEAKPAVPAAKTPEAPSPTPPAAPATTSTPPAPATPVPAAPAASPIVRRRGQFLDMVHPASKMTSQQTSAAPVAHKKLAPVSTDVAPTTSAPATKPETPASLPESSTTPSNLSTAPVTTSEDSAPTSSETKWPDPLDLLSDTDTEEEKPAVEAAPAAVAAESATTPFVSDAKVDKRPLGAFGTSEDAAKSDTTPPADDKARESVPAETGETPKLDTEKEQKTAPMIDTTPPELQPDVVSVESDSGNELVDSNVAEAEPAPVQTPEVSVPAEPIPPAPSAESGLAQSIPQQYKTPQETPDTAPHPLFDTHEYHQPLLPATSKKSKSWLVILIIVLLLVVGAALGYFAFMAGL